MPENQAVKARLDSWKDIAAYLGRDVRTVIRWEKKGLPVHRVPGGQRQAIFAYTDEIDAWLISRDEVPHVSASLDLPSGSIEKPKENPAETLPGAPLPEPELRERVAHPVRFPKWVLLAGGAFLLLLAGVINLVLAYWHRSGPLRPMVTRLTENGQDKVNLRTDGSTLYFNETEGSRRILASAPMSGSPIRPIETPFSNVFLQDLSDDGKTLLITSVEGIAEEGPLWTIPAQGGTPRRVGDTVCSVARWSPDNRQIACSKLTTIIVIDADGSNAQAVGSFSSPVAQLAWIPDGKRLRFGLEETATHTYSAWEIPVGKDRIGTQAQRLPLIPGCADWTWVQNGKTFMYARCDPDGRIRLMLAPESGLQTGVGGAELPVKVGTIVGLTSVKGRGTPYLLISTAPRGELMQFNAQQNAFHPILPGVSGAYLAFSGDGQWMTYTNTLDDSLWRSRPDGSEPSQLTKPPMAIEVSSWSPDSRRIAFTGREPGKPWRIFLIDRDGGPMEEAGEGNDDQGAPSWSPDGKELVYGNLFCEKTQNCWIRRLDVATRKTKIVPGSQGLRTARWSPDGKYIAALSPQTHSLMLFSVSTQRWSARADSITGDNINWSRDSQYVYVDSPRDKQPVIERVRIKDGHRFTVVSLATLEKVPGEVGPWIGLTPDNSPILVHMLNASEVYSLDWTDR